MPRSLVPRGWLKSIWHKQREGDKGLVKTNTLIEWLKSKAADDELSGGATEGQSESGVIDDHVHPLVADVEK